MAKTKVKKSEDIEVSNKPMSNKEMMKMINTRMGEGSIYAFEGEETVKVQPVSTGIPSLDYALGIGGLPWDRLVEIYGPESSGKTTLALKVVAEFQKNARLKSHVFYGKKAVFIDAENALDPFHAQSLGVDISEETGMLISQPECGEQAYDLMTTLILSGQVGLIVGDSLPSFVPKKVIDGSAEDNHIGVQARLNSKMLPIIAKHASKMNCLVIMINQLREKVGVMYGNPENTPGGRALKFYSSVRLDVRRSEIKKGDVFLGQTMKVTVKKNKVSPPFTKTEFDYYWDTGVDVIKDIMNVAMDMGIIKRAGAYYYYGESHDEPYKDGSGNELKWRGKETVEAALKQSPDLFEYTNSIVQGRIPKDAQMIQEDNSEDEQEKDDMLMESEGIID
ncbi:recombinase RecA [Bacillus haynesii]|uniref:recombinase RecA n=1 Tax=Bacillus haynesii TaxID=1925021 RepID=UPI0022827754|nr:recombinase RecA [Bacillus haynesii]MCY8577574.1 recombinase RecA [Bacillus haynesii]MEC1657079.1 recombinase RecA [Bacillus haynesii]